MVFIDWQIQSKEKKNYCEYIGWKMTPSKPNFHAEPRYFNKFTVVVALC